MSFIKAITVTAILLFAATASAAEKVTINFKDTDIREVAEMVSKVSKKNFLIDPRVKGSVTVLSSEPLDGDALYSTFLSILRVHGFVAVDDGNLVRILPASSAREVAPLSAEQVTKDDDRIEVRVIPIEHVPAMQMVPILRPLVEKEGHLAAHANSNSLIVAASGRTINKIYNMLSQLDEEAEAEIETIPLQYAVASEVVDTLQAVVRQVGGDTGKKGAPAAAGTRLVADDRTNSILVSGTTGFRDKVRTIVKQLDTVVRDNRNVHVVTLRFAKAEDLAPIIEQLASEGDVAASAKSGDKGAAQKTKVQADESTNSLIITANPDRMKELRAVIRKLDIRRSQVLVDAIVVEVSEDYNTELGIQWVGLNNAFLPKETDSSGVSTGEIDYGSISNQFTPGTILGLIEGGDYTFAALGSALANDTDFNILSTPSLLTLDNEEAEIVVGQEIPFLTGSYTSGGETATNPFTTLERKTVGLTLKITPQITAGNAVALDVDQQISQALPKAAQDAIGAQDVITTQRNIKTNVLVDDGDILVLGGLIDDYVNETEQRIPIIGDIPILGEPFKYRNDTAVKRNLMIFIRPQILRTSKQNLTATRSRYDGARKDQLVRYEQGVDLMPSRDQPVLPPIDERGREIPVPPDAANKQSGAPQVKPVWVH